MRASNAGFTLVEIMIIAAIIGVLAMICIPNFVQSRIKSSRFACIDNLRKIEGAVEQAKMSGIKTVDTSALFGASGYLKFTPRCPATQSVYTEIDPPVCPSGDTTHVIN